MARKPIFTAGAAEAPPPEPILAAVGEVVYEWSIPEDAILWSRNAAEVLGVGHPDRIATGAAFAKFLDPQHPESRTRAVFGQSGKGGVYRVEYPFHPAGYEDRRRLWIEDLGRWYAGPKGDPVRAHGVIRVIDERHEREERLSFLSRHDELTGCLNRAHLVDALAAAIRTAIETRRDIAFVVAAIDNFDTINEVYGFDIGDEVFAAVAKRIRAEIRAADLVGRFSGGMLGLILMDCSEADMHA
ncbi:MAG TPA: GGDEF domain-containing protein, partial [Bauldia sp.]|nr:GGDEF domain-containing protein [Bauldia sp.]